MDCEAPLKKWMTTHSSILAWRIPWTEEPGGLQSMGSQRVEHNWETNAYTLWYSIYCGGLELITQYLWGIPVCFLTSNQPTSKSLSDYHWLGSVLAGYGPWCPKESDMTEWHIFSGSVLELIDSFRLQRSLWFTGSVGRGKAKRSEELIYETKRNHKTQLPHSINRLSVEIRRKSNVEGDNRDLMKEVRLLFGFRKEKNY